MGSYRMIEPPEKFAFEQVHSASVVRRVELAENPILEESRRR
jgi:hypothetical protein